MRFPIAYFVFDVIINGAVGVTLSRTTQKGGNKEGPCGWLMTWLLFWGIMLTISAVLHLFVIINKMCDSRYSNRHYIGTVLDRMWHDFTDIFIFAAFIAWVWFLLLIALDTKVLKCDRNTLNIAYIFIAYTVVMAFIYNNHRGKILRCNNN